MGWQKGAQSHLTASTIKPGHTLFAVWDPALGDDLGATFDREPRKKKEAPTSTLKKGDTEHVVAT